MKKASLILISTLIASMILTSFGCGDSIKAAKYDEVIIGNQVWMAKNLDVDRFRNGDPIPEANTPEQWCTAYENREPAWCYYNNRIGIGDRYGKLYNWYAVIDPRGLAPKGWKIPRYDDWGRLIDYLGGDRAAGIMMKYTDYWVILSLKMRGNGTNESGFSGLPGGWQEL